MVAKHASRQSASEAAPGLAEGAVPIPVVVELLAVEVAVVVEV